MSNKRTNSLPSHIVSYRKQERGRCVTAICLSWKILSCIFSHVTLVFLVVTYCFGGAYLFQHLERPHEIEIKEEIRDMRFNLTNKIWRFTANASVLRENDWVANVKKDLANFEKQILTAIKTDGWDGDEDVTKSQWTFAGSLFYSIIVITTIGYGHISPRTDWGKVNTIFYAIIGIPLMLLCLSNIGDVMATSFRFLYWRVCCFICTRPTKKSRYRSRQWPVKMNRYSSKTQSLTQKPSMKVGQRLGPNCGIGLPIGMSHAYSDSELRSIKRGAGDYNREISHELKTLGYTNKNKVMKHYESSLVPANCHRTSKIPFGDNDREPNSPQLNHASYINMRQNQQRLGERHTLEREKNIYGAHHINLKEDVIGNSFIPPVAKRAMSFRSVRSQNLINDDMIQKYSEAKPFKDCNRLNSHIMHRGLNKTNNLKPPRSRAKSADPRSTYYDNLDEEMVRNTPIISNRYAIDEFGSSLLTESCFQQKANLRSHSMPRSSSQKNIFSRNTIISHLPSTHIQRKSSFGKSRKHFKNRLELPDSPFTFTSQISHGNHFDRENECDDEYKDYSSGLHKHETYNLHEYVRQKQVRRSRRDQIEKLPPSPRIMSPMGLTMKRHNRTRRSYDYEDDSACVDEWNDFYGDMLPKDRPVPIWLCVFLVVSYILGGAALFAYWENWSFLDSAYFCFITLTTIGFGDFVPAKGVKDESEQSIAYCSLYLLFGIALLAMSFNLVQEEFISNVKEVARSLGILKDDEEA